MTQKHDYKAALDAVNEATEFQPHLHNHIETIRHSLRIAERLMQEPSEQVVASGVIAWKNHPLAVVTQFKAMRDTMLAEIAEDGRG